MHPDPGAEALVAEKWGGGVPVTDVWVAGDFRFAQPLALHKLLKDSQGLWVHIQGAACRRGGWRWVWAAEMARQALSRGLSQAGP